LQKRILNLVAIFCTLLVLAGCNALEGTQLAKFYHDVTAKYNGYFNARELMKDVEEQIQKSQKEDYTEILAVYELGDQKIAKNVTGKCDKVIKKTTKVIQKHDVSKWVDDCYFQMAKGYLYKGDHYAALETFKFIQTKFEGNIRAHESMIWMALTNIQLENYNDAQAILTRIDSEDEFPDELNKDLNLTKAYLHIKLEEYQKAVQPLRIGLPYIEEKNRQNRANFILAQVYQETGQCQQASKLYGQVLNKTPPYELAFHARLNRSKCLRKTAGKSTKEVKEDLLEMVEDDKNIEYFGQIYYELALIAFSQGNRDLGTKYLKKSISTNQGNKGQKGKSYLALARYFFEKAAYEKAKAYYDSTMMFLKEDHPSYEKIASKNDVLNELIKNIQKIELQDSLQNMAELSQEELKNKIQKDIKAYKKNQKAKKKEEKRRERAQERQQRLGNNRNRKNSRSESTGGNNQFGGQDGAWYFYNPRALGVGYSNFQKNWGNRPLIDNWRFKTKASREARAERKDKEEDQIAGLDTAKQKNLAGNDKMPENFSELPTAKKQFYLNIPFTPPQMSASNNEIEEALYQLGSIYEQDLKDYQKAVNEYKQLLTRFPETSYKVQTYYHLYKSFKNMGNEKKAQQYKNKLLSEFPESEYAILIKDPEQFRQMKTQETNPQLENHYFKTYQAYQNDNCGQVIARKNAVDTMFTDNYLRAKYNYLNLLCKGKNDTITVFKENLKQFTNKYANQAIANHAQNLLDYLNKLDEKGTAKETQAKFSTPFKLGDQKPHMYLMIFALDSGQTNSIKGAFSNYNQKYYEFLNLQTKDILYNKDTQMVVVKGFKSKAQALKYMNSIEADGEFQNKLKVDNYSHYVISEENFGIFRKRKNLSIYKKYFNLTYIEE